MIARRTLRCRRVSLCVLMLTRCCLCLILFAHASQGKEMCDLLFSLAQEMLRSVGLNK